MRTRTHTYINFNLLALALLASVRSLCSLFAHFRSLACSFGRSYARSLPFACSVVRTLAYFRLLARSFDSFNFRKERRGKLVPRDLAKFNVSNEGSGDKFCVWAEVGWKLS
ncbi:MAG: hypothetical protein ACTS4T_01120 [Candidatus Hodgkinia cicadicola]